MSSALLSSELISSGVSTHMHVAAQQLLSSGVGEHTCVEDIITKGETALINFVGNGSGVFIIYTKEVSPEIQHVQRSQFDSRLNIGKI